LREKAPLPDTMPGPLSQENLRCMRALAMRRNTGKSLKEIGQAFGVSRERIRQMIAKAARLERNRIENNGILPDWLPPPATPVNFGPVP
jgi:DNA-directed RNA polymerase sigma subunit (sigma70/sigma32)